LAFLDILKLDAEIKKIENKMQENPEDMDLIESYTSILEQFNNFG
jgi:hypothetical protein